MIVDDEADTNFTFKVALQNDGFKVDLFTDPPLGIGGFEIDNKVKICFLKASANYCYYEAFGKEAFPDLDTKNAFIYKPIENTEMIERVNQITIAAASPKV